MPKGDIAIVFDCGATNVRVIAVDSNSHILASESYSNNTSPDPFYPGGKIWDVNEIWEKMCMASCKVTESIDRKRIAGVTVTAFGVDGTLFDKTGKMMYPVISWQCDRTVPVMAGMNKYMSIGDLYAETGVLPFNFNTINKLVWLTENKRALVDKAHIFLFMPSVFSYFLTGEMVNDMTMAGTSMVTSLSSRAFSSKILDKIGFPAEKMGKTVEPGTITGRITAGASAQTSLPQGIPVVATGHDTQFAVFGSGAAINQPVLSSGTWEILMVRSQDFRSGEEQLRMGITTELDVQAGLYDIGNQWLASGILEWARKMFYPDVKENVYDVMIDGASRVPPGSKGVKIIPGFYEELKERPGGEITGLTLDTTRDEIYRAMLEALSLRLRQGLDALEKAGGFRTEKILCVGGGSRNKLWNQLRADYSGVPVIVTDRAETTVLGASMFVQAACGNASSPEEARAAVDYKTEIYTPHLL